MPRVKLFDENAVLSKAMDLFWKQGFHATSMQDLVDFLGINRGSIYDTFGGKKELFDKAFAHYRSTNHEGLRTFFEGQSNVKGAFRTLFTRAVNETIQDCDRKGCFVVNTVSEFVPGDEGLKKIAQENQKIVEGIFTDFIQKGIDSKEISADKNPQEIASVFFTLFNGFKILAKIQDQPDQLITTANNTLRLLD